ncbi:tetratricopeptide repeat protein (macronuclear) [Tetrahymena thermophila SB210]|uniref:Tetratricopeptide repeat protein n=1 Tax=Tetrahymena thermophila (strain SB210) TaxID=312017 RepID=I7MJ99_TETTS|nr:tetratricopeptide repeat protein [Tetrahymena thermophila SB210]EAR96106.2 tetratricopeptide repeat protein [Tetrahymena thermophila SB210]|eukprot:XP_001016351.2 tetratricopeptide repeat protein [Tetrahymena thermophila SB210]
MNTTAQSFNTHQSTQQKVNTSIYNFEDTKIKTPLSGQKKLQSRRNTGSSSFRCAFQDTMSSTKPVFRTNQKFYQNQPKIDKLIDQSPQAQIKRKEIEIKQLLENSALAKFKGDLGEALEIAKQAVEQSNKLKIQKEKVNNYYEEIDLQQYDVPYNLAIQLQANGFYQEALKQYTQIVKKYKHHPIAQNLEVNMGNIYFQLQQYKDAIKMYKRAYHMTFRDSKYTSMRLQILKNIGIANIKQGKYEEAIKDFETIMNEKPDFQTAFNLILCLFELGDKQGIKDCFSCMINIEIPGYNQNEQEEIIQGIALNDPLREYIKEKKKQAVEIIIRSAKFIAPIILDNIIDGYNWVIEALKDSYFYEAQTEIEICKSLAYLETKDIVNSIETLKQFEKRDKIIVGRVSNNISFLYFLEKNFKNAEQYADLAIDFDRFNPKALVNRGNCFFVKNEFQRSKLLYLDALRYDAQCAEALYNLALVNKKLNMPNEALLVLEKLLTIISTPEIIYQVANIYELMGQSNQALKWYQILLTQIPTEANILAIVGSIYARENNELQAFTYYSESFKCCSYKIETIEWLGLYFIKQELYEKASQIFEKAIQIQPKEAKWKFMVAFCYKKMGLNKLTLQIYQEIYENDPQNIECLKCLIQICQEMGLNSEEYAQDMRKLEANLNIISYQILIMKEDQKTIRLMQTFSQGKELFKKTQYKYMSSSIKAMTIRVYMIYCQFEYKIQLQQSLKSNFQSYKKSLFYIRQQLKFYLFICHGSCSQKFLVIKMMKYNFKRNLFLDKQFYCYIYIVILSN